MEATLTKTADFQHRYRGTWDQEPAGICRIRIFEASGHPPIIVCTELPENPSTSVTNMIEYLAAEIVAKHFPHRFDEETPAIWIEHYPAPPPGDYGLRREQDRPDFDRATFSSWRPTIEWLGGQRRVRLGDPSWLHLSADDVRSLIGDPATLDD